MKKRGLVWSRGMSSLAVSLLLVAAHAYAGDDVASDDDATNSHSFWGSATTEPEHGIRAARRWTSPAGRLAKEFPDSKYRLYLIDLDQDGKDDYIAESKTEWRTCFIKSDFSIRNCTQMNLTLVDGFAYEYFLNLDPSEMLYLMDLSGDEATEEYSLERFDKATWKLKELFKIYPLVNSQNQERSGLYWGYPWDIHSISTRIENGTIKVQASLDYRALETPTRWLSTAGYGKADRGVVMLFDGVATQGPPTGEYNRLKTKLRFMSVKEILTRYGRLSTGPGGRP